MIKKIKKNLNTLNRFPDIKSTFATVNYLLLAKLQVNHEVLNLSIFFRNFFFSSLY
jgi:hypothetical protein